MRDEAMRPRVDVSPAAGLPLPPSPMSPARMEVAPDVPLPWSLALWTAGVDVAGCGLSTAVGALVFRDQGRWAFAFLGAALYGVALGVGLAAMDRIARRWPRAARWAVAMALPALVPNLGCLAIPAAPWSVVRSLMLGSAARGLAFGVIRGAALAQAARRAQGRRLRMGLTAAALQVLFTFEGPMEAAVMLGPQHMAPLTWLRVQLPVYGAVALIWAACLGLVIARCLAAAERARSTRTGAQG